jgi:20S proteasome alpha/beta subunit
MLSNHAVDLFRKPKRLSERKRMTIAAGFVCDSGIVMCSDSQESYGDLKWPAQKLVTDNLYGFCPIIVTGAGFAAPIESATQQIISKLQGGYDRKVALELIKEILRDIHQNDLPFFPSDTQSERQFELLIALKTSDMGPRLYKTTGSLIYEVRDYVVIGSGSVVNYSAHSLHSRFMPMSQGVMLAAHLIRLAKSQLTSVGGSSRIATLDHNGHIEYASPWELPNTEDMFGEFLGRTGQLMLKCADPEIDEDGFVKELAEFWKKAIALKQQQIKNRERWEEVWSALSGPRKSEQVSATDETTDKQETTQSDFQKSEDQQ